MSVGREKELSPLVNYIIDNDGDGVEFWKAIKFGDNILLHAIYIIVTIVLKIILTYNSLPCSLCESVKFEFAIIKIRKNLH